MVEGVGLEVKAQGATGLGIGVARFQGLLGLGVWCLVFGVWCLEFDVWCLVFGVCGVSGLGVTGVPRS